MRGIPNSVHVQAAGSWALATLARKNEDLREQALDGGAALACEVAMQNHEVCWRGRKGRGCTPQKQKHKNKWSCIPAFVGPRSRHAECPSCVGRLGGEARRRAGRARRAMFRDVTDTKCTLAVAIEQLEPHQIPV